MKPEPMVRELTVPETLVRCACGAQVTRRYWQARGWRREEGAPLDASGRRVVRWRCPRCQELTPP